MLPSSLLQTALNHQVMLELKSGETYSGLLVKVDNFMNAQVRDAICVDAHTEKFTRVPDVYVRGSSIKYLRLPEEVADMVKPDAGKAATAVPGKKGKGKKKGEAAGPQGRGQAPREKPRRDPGVSTRGTGIQTGRTGVQTSREDQGRPAKMQRRG
eukprot:g6504.t1